ncbi:MAG: Signal recognition particle 19 kDa protein [Methanoregula sp. PtaU1.Bin051]|nr:MAG: Signal recognition particle 19 kDa protein [Methanoregula sp. PtaU1.Bin051]
MADECILYPCYFNAALDRRQGRKVPRKEGAKGPSLQELERALKKLNLRFRAEDKHHPAHWMRHEGRVVVEWKAGKEALIRKVARQMGGRK